MIAALALLASVTQAEEVPLASLSFRSAELDGRTISVRGRLTRCDRRVCELTDDSGGVLIDASASFDRSVRGLKGRQIVVEGRVSGSCFEHVRNLPDGSTMFSTCRSTNGGRIGQISHPRLVAVLPAEEP